MYEEMLKELEDKVKDFLQLCKKIKKKLQAEQKIER